MNTVSKTSFEKKLFFCLGEYAECIGGKARTKNEKGKKCSVGKHFFEIDDGFLKFEFYL